MVGKKMVRNGPKTATLFSVSFRISLYFEKAIKFFEISTVDLFYVVLVKSTVEISQNFVAFSEYRIVASRSTSRLVTSLGLFRLLMKGIFGPYVL